MKYPNGESSQLEFKSDIPQNDQIVKTVIGFCNQHGGKLIIGIDNDRNIVGIDEEKAQEILEHLDKTIHDATSPPIIPSIYPRRYQGYETRPTIEIEVSKGMNKPYYLRNKGIENGTYIRLGRNTVRATSDLIEELKWQSRGTHFENLPVYHAQLSDLDMEKIEYFFKTKKAAVKTVINEQMLLSYQLIIKEHAAIYPTVAGILLFGKNPQAFFSESMIICSHFSGIEGREVIASKDCTGDLFEQFRNAFHFLTQHLNHSFKIEKPKREEKLEVPEIALREIILNAIIHRNYHTVAPSKIAIFDNRIEIFSPGNFPGPLDTTSLREGITFLRNPNICKLFREAGYIEKMGTGFITLFTTYEQYELPEPKVLEGKTYIKCILPRPYFRSTAEKDIIDNDYLRILELFNYTNRISVSQVMQALKVSRSTAGRRLAELDSSGKIKKIGKGRAVTYQLVK